MRLLAYMLLAVVPVEEEHFSLLGRTGLKCVVCHQQFSMVACVQSNTRGGVDRDLFARAVGPQPEFYRIATCPRCGYSGYPADFDPKLTLPPDVLDKILRAPRLLLPDGFGPDADPRELDAVQRYELAIRCFEWQRKSHEALAWLHLRASWIAREEGSILPPVPRLDRVLVYAKRWRRPKDPQANQLDTEMEMVTGMGEALVTGQFNRYQRPYVELAIALILRRHGENRQAAPLLERLAGYEGFSQKMHRGIERMRESITAEREHQRQAARRFELALLTDQIPAQNRGAAQYLLGELSRRLDRDDQAAGWYDKAILDPNLPTDLRTWAGQQRAQCLARP